MKTFKINISLRVIFIFVLICQTSYPQWISVEPKVRRIYLNSIQFVSNEIGVIVGSQGTILHTRNSGDTWDLVASHTDAVLEDVFFLDQKLGWIVGGNGSVLFTCDGGLSWDKFENNITEKLYSVFFLDPLVGWVAGEHNIYRGF